MAEATLKQVRAARALLDWNQADLATAAGVSLATVKRFEADASQIAAIKATIIRTLEDSGIEFQNDGKSVGVKLKMKRSK